MHLVSRPFAGLAVALLIAIGVAGPATGQKQPEGGTHVPVQRSAAADQDRYTPFASAEEFVEQQYVDILRRAASQSEVAYQAGLLKTGREPSDLIAEFIGSAEADSNIKSVVRLYRAYYLRNPDFRGLTHWIKSRHEGASLNSISTQFARAPEFALRYGVLDDEAFVDFVYERVMRREPDARGRAYWLNRLATDIHRGQFMTYFSESPEYVNLTRFITSAVALYHGMFQRSITEGRASSLVSSLSSERTTVAETAAEYLGHREYVRRFVGPTP